LLGYRLAGGQFCRTITAALAAGAAKELHVAPSPCFAWSAHPTNAASTLQGLVVLTSLLIVVQRLQIAELAVKFRLPTISLFSFFPRFGGH